MRQAEIYDTSLRDGVQGRGISYSAEDRCRLAQLLDELGVGYIECGNPASNPKDRQSIARIGHSGIAKDKLTVFGATRRAGVRAEDDPGLKALLDSGIGTAAIVGKARLSDTSEILRVSADANIDMIGESILFLTKAGLRVFFDAEHFFDGYRQDAQYAMLALRTAAQAGAERLVLCDTNGGTLPDVIARVCTEICRAFPGQVGIHCHNDSATAVASTIMAVQAGAVQAQGVVLGYGERCGNAELLSIIAALELKAGISCIGEEHMRLMTPIARSIAAINNTTLEARAPYVGENAFSHKGGMHIDGVLKDTSSFEHIDPALVGNSRELLLSEFAGRAAFAENLRHMYPQEKDITALAEKLRDKLKSLEGAGYNFEDARASFELLAHRQREGIKPYFKVDYYKVVSELPDEQSAVSAMAMIKVDVAGQKQITAYEGLGPVNALDGALRKALRVFYPCLAEVRLTDYKVRVLDSSATASHVRVVIESSDAGRSWTTVGVSTDVIHASFMALTDSVEYKLFTEGV